MKMSNARGPTAPVVNAFQFMMNNRNKIIGTNSPGKEIDHQTTEENDYKKIKSVRKVLLENWADAKGATKRKRLEDEKTICVNNKMEKRTKRLKKLLKVDESSDEDEVVLSTRKKCANIDSDDSSQDSKPEVKSTKKKKRRSTSGSNSLLMSPNSLSKWKIKINLKEDDADINEKANKDNEIVEENGPRRSSRLKTVAFKSLEEFLSDDDDNQIRKPVKVAPVFLKSVPKPKVAPEVLEAKRQFLMSELPSSLRMEVQKPDSVVETEFDLFPSVSHVQQKLLENIFWDLPEAELNLSEREESDIKIEPFNWKISYPSSEQFSEERNLKKTNFKKVIKEIKANNPNYPVYKSFKSLYQKSGLVQLPEKETPKRKRKKKIKEEEKVLEALNKFDTMWTEKYKSRGSDDILGNGGGIKALKEWLKNFNVRKKDCGYNSGSDFEITDGDSRDSQRMISSTVVVKGPSGCGKSSAIYAICNDLGFNILEVNASSKRTGKWLLQELQEATQSHQVRKKQTNDFLVEKSDSSPQKFGVLLVEDVDLVFEQDEGFTTALSQIILTSKRPIILTTTDERSPFVQKFINQHQTISFLPLTPAVLSIWLQIICVIEGCNVNLKTIQDLLVQNKGDARRTLLHLQFWVTSNRAEVGAENIFKEEPAEDEKSNSSVEEKEIDLEVIWWNLPNLLELPDFSHLRLTRNNEKQEECHNKDVEKEKRKINFVSEVYDSLSLSDTIRRSCNDDLAGKSRSFPKNSLELQENLCLFSDENFREELSNSIIHGGIAELNTKKLTTAVPSVKEKKWRSKQISSESRLEEAVLDLNILDRKSMALDYLPALRTIARSEVERAANNTKRRNRFYNYLTNLGVNCNDSAYQVVCNILQN